MSFRLELSSEESAETIGDIESFVASDESGSFGILTDREPFVTALSWGLCRFRTVDGKVQYVALPGGILSFSGNVLCVATSHYLRDDDGTKILEKLNRRMRAEVDDRRAMRETLKNLDRELLRRLLKEEAR